MLNFQKKYRAKDEILKAAERALYRIYESDDLTNGEADEIQDEIRKQLYRIAKLFGREYPRNGEPL